MVDNAIFKRARINEEKLKNKHKAMNLYEKLLKDYPTSIYTVVARKRYRELKGDIVN